MWCLAPSFTSSCFCVYARLSEGKHRQLYDMASAVVGLLTGYVNWLQLAVERLLFPAFSFLAAALPCACISGDKHQGLVI